MRYCGLEPAVEAEHVIAKCIIPKPRPTMITVPVCGICNDRKKFDDEQLRGMLVMDIKNEGHATPGLFRLPEPALPFGTSDSLDSDRVRTATVTS